MRTASEPSATDRSTEVARARSSSRVRMKCCSEGRVTNSEPPAIRRRTSSGSHGPLAAPYTAYIARLTRSSMLEVLTQDYIRTARAKGLSNTAVIYKHGLRVAILPIVSFLGPLAANLLTGSIVVESIFSIPGAGGFFVNSVLNRDGFLLAGVVIVYCSLLVVFNLVVDLLYGLLDHRISLYE